MSTPLHSIVTLRHALATLRKDPSTDRAFAKAARAQPALFKALPPKFEQVWLELVDRLESSVKVEPSGLQYDVEGDLSLLEAAEMSRVELPSSCRNGTCRTCLCKLVSGEVTYTVEWPGLSAEEKAEGYVLPCVARPTTHVVIEQTEARSS